MSSDLIRCRRNGGGGTQEPSAAVIPSATAGAQTPLGRRSQRGQSMAEFALMVPLLIAVVFIAITFAVIGQAALAVSQLAYNGARYAAVNPTLSTSQISSYIQSGNIGSPTITKNSGANLTVTVTRTGGSYQPVTVTVAYNLSGNPLVGSMSKLMSALGYGSSFPTTLSATEIVMSE
jgi:Flp pilus assembly protein TadG